MDILNTLFDHPWYWLIGGAALMGLEIIAAGVYLLWIGLAMVTTGLAVALFPGLPLAAQIIILIVTMIVSVLIGVRLQSRSKATNGPALNAGLDQYVGRRVLASQDFVGGQGRVKIEDTTYNAIARGDVRQGETLMVAAVENGVFFVEPLEPIAESHAN